MRHAQLALLIAFLAIGMSACRGEDSPIAAGTSGVSDGKYTNEYFGLTLSIRDDWFAASKDTEQFLRDVGEDILSGGNADMKAAIEASKTTTFLLLTLSEFEMGAAVEFNPNIILMAERVSHLPGIKSGKEYLFHTTKSLLQTQLPYEIAEETYSTQLGNREWYRADFVINQPLNPIDQSYCVIKHKDFVLAVILTAATEEQMVELERIADSISFSRKP